MSDVPEPPRRMVAVAMLAGDDAPHLVSATGELDTGTAGDLARALGEAVAHGPNDVVVDLTHTTFLDSTTIALLMKAQRRLVRAGRGFAVAVPEGPTARIFQITALQETLGVRPSVTEAVELAGKRRTPRLQIPSQPWQSNPGSRSPSNDTSPRSSSPPTTPS